MNLPLPTTVTTTVLWWSFPIPFILPVFISWDCFLRGAAPSGASSNLIRTLHLRICIVLSILVHYWFRLFQFGYRGCSAWHLCPCNVSHPHLNTFLSVALLYTPDSCHVFLLSQVFLAVFVLFFSVFFPCDGFLPENPRTSISVLFPPDEGFYLVGEMEMVSKRNLRSLL